MNLSHSLCTEKSVAAAYSQKLAELPETHVPLPPMQPVKPVRAPRSATRTYTPGEMATAAAMLEKLHRRDDLARLARRVELPDRYDRDKTIDVVVDRLLQQL